jgi:hypothetical protein
MRIFLVTLVLALLPQVGLSQATTIEEPPPPGLVQEFTRLLGIHRAIGDLTTVTLSDSALELRFWSIGWTISGVRLQKSSTGEWRAQRINIAGPNSATIDSVPTAASNRAGLDSMWNKLVNEGILTLPTHVPRSWRMLDGQAYLLELRRGHLYRAVHIEHVENAEVPADTAIKRIARIFQNRFPFLPMPAR